MTTRTTLLALAERVEAATTTEQREMLEAAFVAVHGPKPARVHGGTSEWIAWLDLHNPFFALLQAGGFLDAAMSLVPSGCSEWNVEAWKAPGAIHPAHVRATAWVSGAARVYASTPALALTAACLRALAVLEQDNG